MQAPRTLGRVLEGSIDSFQTFLRVFPLADIYVPQVHSWVNYTHPFMATHHHLTMQNPFFLVWIIFTSYFHSAVLLSFPHATIPLRLMCIKSHSVCFFLFTLNTTTSNSKYWGEFAHLLPLWACLRLSLVYILSYTMLEFNFLCVTEHYAEWWSVHPRTSDAWGYEGLITLTFLLIFGIIHFPIVLILRALKGSHCFNMHISNGKWICVYLHMLICFLGFFFSLFTYIVPIFPLSFSFFFCCFTRISYLI